MKETRNVLRQFAEVLCGLCLLEALAGCGGIVGTSLDNVATPGYTYLTGNWQLAATDASGNPTFSSFEGFIYEQTGAATASHTLTGAFQVLPGSCYLGAATVPATGTVSGTAVQFRSFSVNGQYLELTLTKNSTANQLNGTYQVGGGCASGATGTVTGTRYAPLTGTYSGAILPSQTIGLSLTQATYGNGDGYSAITGTATFSGVSCFTSGTLASASEVIGQSATLAVTANDGELVRLQGTFDPTADAITITSGTISGGACAGSLNAGTLART